MTDKIDDARGIQTPLDQPGKEDIEMNVETGEDDSLKNKEHEIEEAKV